MTNIKTLTATVVFAAGVGFAGAAGAASLGTLSTPFFPGDGNSNTNFVIDTNDAENIEIGVKAKAGFQGDVPNDGVNTYFVDTGSRTHPTLGFQQGLAKWNLEWSVNVGSAPISDYDIFLTLDFNPAAGNTDLAVFDFNLPTPLTDSLVQSSQNLGFDFWALSGVPNAGGFDVNAQGEYFIGLDVFEKGTTTSLASVSAFVNAAAPIPVPAGLPLVLGGLGALYAMKRRKQRG